MHPILWLPVSILGIMACFGLLMLLIKAIIFVGEHLYDRLREYFDGETSGLLIAIFFVSSLIGTLLWLGWMESR